MSYELLDCGNGRKAERFGAVTVVRPAPGARGRPRDPDAWAAPDLTWTAEGAWHGPRTPDDAWELEVGGLRLELRATESGQVGYFPEHDSVREAVRARIVGGAGTSVLDLFGYTGAATVAAAAAGASVTHVDGARSATNWMRRNLERNGLADAPVRSITEDVRRFVQREARRERRYEVILLDPPTFGRGPQGAPFRIDRDLDDLLAGVRTVLAESPKLVALTAHTEGWSEARLVASLDRALDGLGGRTRGGELSLRARSGATLGAGWYAMREFA